MNTNNSKLVITVFSHVLVPNYEQNKSLDYGKIEYVYELPTDFLQQVFGLISNSSCKKYCTISLEYSFVQCKINIASVDNDWVHSPIRFPEYIYYSTVTRKIKKSNKFVLKTPESGPAIMVAVLTNMILALLIGLCFWFHLV